MTAYPAILSPAPPYATAAPTAKVLTVYALPGRSTNDPAVLPATYADGYPLPVQDLLAELPLAPGDHLSFACGWFAKCDRRTDRLYAHPVLGLTAACPRCYPDPPADHLYTYRKDHTDDPR